MRPVKTRFLPGDFIADRYKVERVLGQGGMGVVYLVNDQKTDAPRALKTLRPRYMTDENAMRRFTREVRALRQLDHPAIVKIYEARRIGPLLFYTMDYIEGKSLSAWLRQRKRLGLGSTVRVLALVAHALEHAHTVTIHRDISPENVMVLRDGSVRLLDFGLAKLEDQQGAFTMMGDRLGKVQYKAPEQTVNAASVDARADLYSLGVMFFMLLAGRLPKPGERLTDAVPGLPRECDAFVEKAMAQSPDDRFATAREFRLALMDVYQARPRKQQRAAPQQHVEAPPPPPEEGTLRRLLKRLSRLWAKLAGARARRPRQARSNQTASGILAKGRAGQRGPSSTSRTLR